MSAVYLATYRGRDMNSLAVGSDAIVVTTTGTAGADIELRIQLTDIHGASISKKDAVKAMKQIEVALLNASLVPNIA